MRAWDRCKVRIGPLLVSKLDHSILLTLHISYVRRADRFYPTGQANHFNRYAPERIEYGVNRYVNETRRLYGVLDKQLEKSKSGYLVGDHISIADISTWGWVAAAGWAGVDINEFPNLKAWEERMYERPGVDKGRNVPDPHYFKEIMKDKEAIEKHAAETREWVQKGMKADKKN